MQRTIIQEGQPLRLAPTVSGEHTIVITPKERKPLLNRIPPALPFVDYRFATQIRSHDSQGTERLLGCGPVSSQQGRQPSPLRSQCRRPHLVDRFEGENTTTLQLLDPHTSPVGLPWLGDRDSGIRSLPISGTYRIRLSDAGDSNFPIPNPPPDGRDEPQLCWDNLRLRR